MLAVAGVLAAFSAVGYFVLRPKPEPHSQGESRSIEDPRLAYGGPYQNIHPDVKYVGDEACALCHDQQTESFRRHPMGRSLFPMGSAPLRPPIDEKHRNPFSALARSFRIEQNGGRTVHHEFRGRASDAPIYDFPMEVKYAIGSGTHAQSYLWEKEGYLLQTPISWYAQKGIWDVSPGWLDVGGGRSVDGRCLFCHSNRVEPMAGYANRFAEPVFRGHTIGCERCHGPGEKHVAYWNGQAAPGQSEEYTIVNPRKLPWRQREAVCRQCHSEGETRFVKRGRELFDYRPGLPLEDFWCIVVRSEGEEEFKVVNHVEQLERSRCFQQSRDDNKLGCISCHDPHVKPAESQRVAHYRTSCLKCHESKPCHVPVAERTLKQPDDSCVACHMPRETTQEIPHISGTDHRIMRRPTSLAGHPDDAHMPPGVLPVRLLHRSPGSTLTAEDRRDLGVALAELLSLNKLHARYAENALQLLDESLQTAGDDVAAWEMKGSVLARLGKTDQALAAYREALKLRPNSENSIQAAALLSMQLKRTDDAIELWQKHRGLNPYRSLSTASLSFLLAGKGKWREAKEAADHWLQWEPGSVEGRRVRILCLLRLGERAEAAREFAILQELQPANLLEIQNWWRIETQPMDGPKAGAKR